MKRSAWSSASFSLGEVAYLAPVMNSSKRW
jgi:hypothetical protein